MSTPRHAESVPFNAAFIFGSNPLFVAQQREDFPFDPLGSARISKCWIEENLPNGTPKVRYLAIAPVQLLKHFFESNEGWRAFERMFAGLSGEHVAIVASISLQCKYLLWTQLVPIIVGTDQSAGNDGNSNQR